LRLTGIRIERLKIWTDVAGFNLIAALSSHVEVMGLVDVCTKISTMSYVRHERDSLKRLTGISIQRLRV
jgi:hypothetical protein